MNDQLSAGTGICPYQDCRATITPGKKFCKTCGRAVQSAMASPPPSAAQEQQAAPTPEPVTAAGSKSVNEPAHSQDLQTNTIPLNAESAAESSLSAPDAPVELPRPTPIRPSLMATSQRLLIAGGIAVLTLLAVFGYWFTKPKTVHVAAMGSEKPVNLPTNTSLPPTIRKAQPPLSTTAKETRDAGLTQHDDALRRERELITAERARLEQVQQEARRQEQQRQQELEQRQQEAETQRKALAELKATQEKQQGQIDETKRKLAEEQILPAPDPPPRPTPPPPPPISPPASTYRGPSSGEIVWEGTIKGTELITIENGQSSSGTVLGALPGVAVLIQPTDTKKVSIASTPSPRNQYNRLVVRVSGNGNTRVVLKWSLP